ncbi:RND family efflux transporter, MFP subunit [Hydrobacter penzbergensis]|uniref:RND family efflux transporter, MFP subunit n=2 Tax=Hydrobacter penzbergensis TaxID=1235997 RepID=A0A8X8LH75_9BACT|nr:RND family efflux transporter, MFP subunit [Hydrobacter penzbergensis]
MKYLIPAVLLSAAAACNQPQEAAGIPKEDAKTDTVKVLVLSLDSAKKAISLPGELLPYENAQVRSKIQGYVRQLSVDIGSKVNKGQVLALIDAPEINTRVLELNEKVKAAMARYHASKDYFDRIALASKSDGVIAPLELERIKNQMMADSSEYNAAVLAAKSYRQVGNYLAIIAPYNGTITKRNVVVGSFVGNPADKPLFELESNGKLRLQVAVPEVYTNAGLFNNTGELTTRSLPDKKFKAALMRKSGSISSDTRSELWEFEIPNTTGELKAGGYADVKLQFVRSGRSLTAPVSAIVTTQERKFVIKVTGNTVHWVDVRAGFNMGDKQELFGDIKAGDTLVAKASEELKDGTKIITKR